MTLETVTLKLDRKLLSDAQVVAKSNGVSIAEMIRQFLRDEAYAHAGPLRQRKARALSRLAPVFALACGWDDLLAALGKRGYALRAQGSGLAIYSAADGRFLCNTATVGHRYRKLVKRFGATMPGHPFGLNWVSDAARRSVVHADDLEVIDTRD